ncbi:NAD(P)-binding protein, partial [Clathrospora elynae]
DQELIQHLSKTCRISASAGARYDWAHIITLSKTDKMATGITYCNGGRASSEAVADMAIWHILSVFRNLIWSAEAATVADTKKSDEAEKAINAMFYEISDMLVEADCMVPATPFFGEKLITAECFPKFKKGRRFVNIARGKLVDENSLVDAQKRGHIFAAGLDVHENEPYVHPEFCKMRDVSLTFHNADGAWDTAAGFERLAMENIEALLLQGRALTPVNAHLVEAKTGSES